MSLIRIETAHAQIVSKIRSTTHGRAIAGDGLQPKHGSLNERARRHQYRGKTAEDRLENAADQPHVMVRRQPEDSRKVC